jgi:tetratricopeptide (TPR) repeat protein
MRVKHLAARCTAIGLALVLCGCGFCAAAQNDARASAFALEKQGRNAEAEAAWRVLATESPANPEPLAHIGLLEAREEHYTEAVKFYRQALALDPSMAGLKLNLGLAYFKGGEYKQAIQVFEPMLKQPSSPAETQRLTLLLGMSHYGLGEYAAAASFLKQSSDDDPRNLTLLLTLAHSCLLSKQYPCVLDTYHRIVAVNAESAEADMLVGEAMDEMKDTAGATKEFRAAIAVNPKEPNVHFGLGYLLWKQNQYPEAAQEFQAELANTPGYTQAMLYLADSEIQMNRMEQARPLLEEIVKGSPSVFMARLDLGIVDTESDRKQEALRELKAAEALKPNDVNVHWRMARLYRSMGKSAEAKQEFDKAGSLTKAADDTLMDVLSTSEKKKAAPAESDSPQK